MREFCWLPRCEECFQGWFKEIHPLMPRFPHFYFAHYSLRLPHALLSGNDFMNESILCGCFTNFGNQSSIRTHVPHSWTHMGSKIIIRSKYFFLARCHRYLSVLCVLASSSSNPQERQNSSDLWIKRWLQNT